MSYLSRDTCTEDDVVNRLAEHVKACDKFRKYLLSPYIVLIQSSGSGKSRLLFQVATIDGMKVVYMCLRSKSSSGYPDPNELTKKFFKDLSDLADTKRVVWRIT